VTKVIVGGVAGLSGSTAAITNISGEILLSPMLLTAEILKR